MLSTLLRLRAWAEHVAAGLLAALFATFLLQIFTRYVISMPLGWTVEFCLTLWLWLTFWCGAFVLTEADHVKFDAVYNWVGSRAQRRLSLISALAVGGSMLMALPATWDYVTFYKIKKSVTLGWRLDFVFSVYLLFAVAMIIGAGWRIWHLWRARRLPSLPRGNEPMA
jgi:TRAP-type C4-dicarboxylate transport system permease small subunit